MKKQVFKTLKIGDIVTPNRGKNKGQRCTVKDIWGVMIYADFINTDLHARCIGKCHDVFVNYRALTKEEKLDFNCNPKNIIGHVKSITENNGGLTVTVSRKEKQIELTQDEIDVILKVAAKCGCDWDGDVLKIYVNEAQDRIEFLKP